MWVLYTQVPLSVLGGKHLCVYSTAAGTEGTMHIVAETMHIVVETMHIVAETIHIVAETMHIAETMYIVAEPCT